ncbi:DUF1538 domain-containing protein [Roseospirillum parvum]|uniref:DUF1538 domain-containing protein n=1 Tax=Roseospirillum parvum TaxID=83401 RepID=A0A1G7V6S4_9PROT|nr:DUF1538 domain-containing protein [Roseospirillum parvum]SDG55512.1 Protein of unknown function [Roseospirillum parvum]
MTLEQTALDWLEDLADTLAGTLLDVVPIASVLFGFQYLILRRKVPNIGRVVAGFIYVVIGLTLFLVGLEKALFPLGRLMATQLTSPDFLGLVPELATWSDYGWVYLFAALIGFSTTIAEPALIAVALKVQEVSGGAIRAGGLRLAVAAGASMGVTLGTLRIIEGLALHHLIIGAYAVVIVQTLLAPKAIIPLAYDSGGVTTSTVTVPLVTALGLGLASVIPGRSPLLDGFGMIALTCLFPMITVMGYAQMAHLLARLRARRATKSPSAPPSSPEAPS